MTENRNISVPPPRGGKLKSLGVRAITGLTLLGICGLPVYFGGWLFIVLVGLIGLRLLYEWVRMSVPGHNFFDLGLPFIVLLTALYFSSQSAWSMALLMCAAGFVLCIIRALKQPTSYWTGFGVIYIVMPAISAVYLRGFGSGFADPGFAKMALIIAAVIGADSFAYLGGSLMKGPKLAPRISPNKTWSGFLSGLILGAAGCSLIAFWLGLNPQTAFIFAVPVVLMSVAGDLFESAVKRRLHVKDAGDILPGHGGLLDRADSLLFAIGFCALVLALWPQLWTALAV